MGGGGFLYPASGPLGGDVIFYKKLPKGPCIQPPCDIPKVKTDRGHKSVYQSASTLEKVMEGPKQGAAIFGQLSASLNNFLPNSGRNVILTDIDIPFEYYLKKGKKYLYPF